MSDREGPGRDAERRYLENLGRAMAAECAPPPAAGSGSSRGIPQFLPAGRLEYDDAQDPQSAGRAPRTRRPQLAYPPEGSTELEEERFRAPVSRLEAQARYLEPLAGRSVDMSFQLTAGQAAELRAALGLPDDGPGEPVPDEPESGLPQAQP